MRAPREIGRHAHGAQQIALKPQQRQRHFMRGASLERVEQRSQCVEQGGIGQSRLCRAQCKVARITCRHGRSPPCPQRFAEDERRAFTDVVDTVALSGVEHQFARVADVVASDETAFGALRTLYGRGDAAIIRRQPCDHVGGLRERPHIQAHGFAFQQKGRLRRSHHDDHTPGA